MRAMLFGDRASAAPGRFTVVLTATVTPFVQLQQGLVVVDPAVRLHQYADALSWWLAHPDERIGDLVLLENSGAAPDDFKSRLKGVSSPRRAVEFISVEPSRPPPGMHYGFSEFELVDKGLSRSSLYAASEYFIKATGRYRFPELSRLVDRSPRDFRIVIDCVDHATLRGTWIRTLRAPLVLARRDFFDATLRSLYLRMTPVTGHRTTHVEDLWFDTLVATPGQGIVLRFPVNCEPAGIGGNGEDLRAPSKRIKAAVRGVARVLLPRLWL
jgi:hypothetical protein